VSWDTWDTMEILQALLAHSISRTVLKTGVKRAEALETLPTLPAPISCEPGEA
jgi:hypothetical protein